MSRTTSTRSCPRGTDPDLLHDLETRIGYYQEQIDIESYGIRETHDGSLSPERGKGELERRGAKDPWAREQLYKRIADDRAFGKALRDFLFERGGRRSGSG